MVAQTKRSSAGAEKWLNSEYKKPTGFAAALDGRKSNERKEKSNKTPILLALPTGRTELP